jgi:hypothetical protein
VSDIVKQESTQQGQIRPWTLHKQPAELVSSHGYSIFEGDERLIVLLDPMPGHEGKLALIVEAVNSHASLLEERERLKEALEDIANEVPTTWLDPLLTGPGTPKLPLDGPAVEWLLRVATRVRFRARSALTSGKRGDAA